MIEVTQHAVNQLRALLEQKNLSPDDHGLRLAVERGGCAGLNYIMQIASPERGDHVVEKDGIRLFIDGESADFYSGCVVDYEDTLNDSGFKIQNPNAARTCGCGTSFEATSSTAT